jgi:hypothetical protein
VSVILASTDRTCAEIRWADVVALGADGAAEAGAHTAAAAVAVTAASNAGLRSQRDMRPPDVM